MLLGAVGMWKPIELFGEEDVYVQCRQASLVVKGYVCRSNQVSSRVTKIALCFPASGHTLKVAHTLLCYLNIKPCWRLSHMQGPVPPCSTRG